MADFGNINDSLKSGFEDLKGKYGGTEQMRSRYEELKGQADNGALSGRAKEEFEQLKSHFEGGNK